MPCRYEQLKLALNGWEDTGVPLVSKWGDTYGRAGFPDDIGIYYFVPWIAKTFGISLDASIHLFLGSLLLIGFLVSGGCFLFLFKHWISKALSLFATLLLALVAYFYSDVYIVSYFSVATVVPLFLLYNQKNKIPYPVLIISGLILGYCNFIRNQAGTGVLLFIFTWIFCNQNLKKKFFCLAVILLFFFLPYLHFGYVEAKRDAFLQAPKERLCHPKWHTIYLGLGYLKNPYGIEFNDRIADDKAKSILPGVKNSSPEYERILKDQCIHLLKSDPLFILKTLLAKFLFLCFKALLFLNFGLIFYFYVKPSFRFTLPFLVSALFFSLPGLLAVPFTAYVLGMVSLATLFGVYMIGKGLEKIFHAVRLA